MWTWHAGIIRLFPQTFNLEDTFGRFNSTQIAISSSGMIVVVVVVVVVVLVVEVATLQRLPYGANLAQGQVRHWLLQQEGVHIIRFLVLSELEPF